MSSEYGASIGRRLCEGASIRQLSKATYPPASVRTLWPNTSWSSPGVWLLKARAVEFVGNSGELSRLPCRRGQVCTPMLLVVDQTEQDILSERMSSTGLTIACFRSVGNSGELSRLPCRRGQVCTPMLLVVDQTEQDILSERMSSTGLTIACF